MSYRFKQKRKIYRLSQWFRPTSVLSGHKAGIIDIKIRAAKNQILTYSKDAVIKLWDLNKTIIIQTLSLHFPAFSVLGKEV